MTATAHDSYFRDRLEDPSLVDRAVEVGGLLAVPVGGKRRAGWLGTVGTVEEVLEIVAFLHGQDPDGFPGIRYEWQCLCEECDGVNHPDEDGYREAIIRWGSPEWQAGPIEDPLMGYMLEDIMNGRLYGYREAAIREYVTERYPPDVLDGNTWCDDCDLDAWQFPEDGHDVHEDFYVHDVLWHLVCPEGHILCIGCFEKRLGRQLERADFKGPPRDLYGDPPSSRFRDRWEKAGEPA